jgi:phosphopantetheinyl transferase (holo-ACP synthase)
LTCIGNDIVDLNHPGNRGKSRDRRFVSRVFTAEEQERIDGAAAPDALLWMLWAAKEAAFKAAVKRKPGTAFIPRAYAVTLADFSSANDRREDVPSDISIASDGDDTGFPAIVGAVTTPAGPIDFSCSRSAGHVHCVAVMNGAYRMARPDTDVLAVARKLTGPVDPSSALRWEAIHYLASALKVSPFFIRIHREKMGAVSGPPRVYMEGRPTDMDISLSHDGRYIAFAVHLPGAGYASERRAASSRFF